MKTQMNRKTCKNLLGAALGCLAATALYGATCYDETPFIDCPPPEDIVPYNMGPPECLEITINPTARRECSLYSIDNYGSDACDTVDIPQEKDVLAREFVDPYMGFDYCGKILFSYRSTTGVMCEDANQTGTICEPITFGG